MAVRGARRPDRREGRGRSAGPLGLTLPPPSLPSHPRPCPRQAPALTPAQPRRDHGQPLPSALLQPRQHISPRHSPPPPALDVASFTAFEAPQGHPPFPAEAIMGVQLHPGAGGGHACAQHIRARAPAHPGALLCTVARWIVFASSSRKSPRPTPTHPCLCLGEHLVLVISRGKGCGGLGWRGHEVRGFLTRFQASRGKAPTRRRG